jgi:hypothetical protein
MIDGEGAKACEHFAMAIKTWDSQKACSESSSSQSTSLQITPGADPQTMVLAL